MRIVSINRKSIIRRLQDRWAYSLDTWFSDDPWITRSVSGDASIAPIGHNPPPQTPRHLLLPTVGKGNIGDQAMLEAFLLNTTWPVTLLVESCDGHEIPEATASRVHQVVIPDLFANRPWIRRKVRSRVARLIASHSTFSIVGADMMDGGYSAAQSTIRSGMLSISNAVGTPSRVLGFSWNGIPPEAVQRAMHLSQPKSLLCVRDPHSLARLRTGGTFNSVQTADIVFTMSALEPYERITPWLRGQRDRKIVIVNVSGMLARKVDQTAEYAEIVAHLIQRGCSIIVLPHVIRGGDDDLVSCAATVELVGPNPHVYLIDELLRPAQVAWVSQHASAVLTGRMHLSILSLNQGVPAAVLSSQGKVTGLLELFSSPQLVLEPDDSIVANAIAVLNEVLDDTAVRAQIAEHLPHVRHLSLLNFAGLESE